MTQTNVNDNQRIITSGSSTPGIPTFDNTSLDANSVAIAGTLANILPDEGSLPADASIRANGGFYDVRDVYEYLYRGGLVEGDFDDATPMSFVYIIISDDDGDLFYQIYISEES